jgi:hypothetical protein
VFFVFVFGGGFEWGEEVRERKENGEVREHVRVRPGGRGWTVCRKHTPRPPGTRKHEEMRR